MATMCPADSEKIRQVLQDNVSGNNIDLSYPWSESLCNWIMCNICLLLHITPKLREEVKSTFEDLYEQLKATSNIDKQSNPNILKCYPQTSGYHLNYKNINNNNPHGNFDYCVQNAVDLSKLFLNRFLAHYPNFDSCDPSALLISIINCSGFTPAIRNAAEQCRRVRKKCAHYVASDWEDEKIDDYYFIMEGLVNNLTLTSKEKSSTRLEILQCRHKAKEVFCRKSGELDYNEFAPDLQEMRKILDEIMYKQEKLITEALRIPPEILHMGSRSKEVYIKALEDGTEKNHDIRIMVVGQYGVGKTALTKRLLGEDVDISERNSTDGIDIHVRRCRISLKESKWIIESLAAQDFTTQRIVKVLQRTRRDHSKDAKTFQKGFEDRSRTHVENSKENLELPETSVKIRERKRSHQMLDKPIVKKYDQPPLESNIKVSLGSSHMEEEDILSRQIKEVIAGAKRQVSDDDFADVSIWDFGGQPVFYTTHQMFLSHRAIYILVIKISQHTKDIMDDKNEHYFDCSEKKSVEIEGFLDNWLYSIHGQAKRPGFPRIILVGTHTDELDPVNKEEQMNAVFEAIRNRFHEKDVSLHFISKDFGLSNAVSDPRLEDLRQTIIAKAKEQSYWGEDKPAKWIPFEKVFDELRNKHVEIISREELDMLNKNLPVPITRPEELELFLRFQHDVGSIMYFSFSGERYRAIMALLFKKYSLEVHDCFWIVKLGVPELNGKIVLNPQFLVNALKSLITSEMFWKEKNLLGKWKQFKKDGKLKKSLLGICTISFTYDDLWDRRENQQFQENREHILSLMEHLNIIARPVVYAEDGESLEEAASQCIDYYLVPCVLEKAPTQTELLQNQFASTSWFCLKLEEIAFPSAIFHRLLAGCISRWSLVTTQDKHFHIYFDCGQFYVDENRLHRLTMEFSVNIIALSITTYSKINPDPDVSICQNVYSTVKQTLQRIGRFLSIDIKFEEYVQCPVGHTVLGRCMHSVQTLKKYDELTCDKHNEVTVFKSKDLLKYWFDSEETNHNTKSADRSQPLDLSKIADRIPNDKELGRISHQIGMESQQLAFELGISKATVQQIKMSNPYSAVDQTSDILFEWRKQEGHLATFEKLVAAMEAVGLNPQDALKDISEQNTASVLYTRSMSDL